MRVLITGAGGFIGSNLAGYLARHGHEVTAIWRNTARRIRSVTGITWVQADLCQAHDLPRRVDAIVHCAARFGTDIKVVDDNVDTTRSIVAYAEQIHVGQMIYLSSVDVYGKIDVEIVDEMTPINNPSSYGQSKLTGEKLISAARDMRTIALRLPGVVGTDSNHSWIARLIDEIVRTGIATVYNPDAPFNNSLHVDDCSRFIHSLLEGTWQGHDVLTLGAAAPIPVALIVEKLAAYGLPRAEIRIAPGQRHSYTISIEKAVARHQFSPMTMTEQLRQVVAER